LLLPILLPALSLLIWPLLWPPTPLPTTTPLAPPLVLPLLLLLLWLLECLCTHQQNTGASHLLLSSSVQRWGGVPARVLLHKHTEAITPRQHKTRVILTQHRLQETSLLCIVRVQVLLQLLLPGLLLASLTAALTLLLLLLLLVV
jgi:hypothetical protein